MSAPANWRGGERPDPTRPAMELFPPRRSRIDPWWVATVIALAVVCVGIWLSGSLTPDAPQLRGPIG